MTTTPITDAYDRDLSGLFRLDPALDEVTDRELLEAIHARLARLDELVAKVEPMVEAMASEVKERGIMGIAMAAFTGRG